MSANTKHGRSESKEQDSSVAALVDYCTERGIKISKKIAFRRVPGRGLGVFSTQRILRGERLMSIPNMQLFTIESIPKTFLPKKQHLKLPVHALFAAYFTFSTIDAYVPWIATWPTLLDFTTSMPMFWPTRLHSQPTSIKQTHDNKRARTTSPNDHVPSPPLLPPSLTNAWCPPSIAISGASSSVSLLRTKLQNHLSAIASVFPDYAESILSPGSDLHWRFVHNWCCVNSRCFFHSTKTHAPSSEVDVNECLALAPGMDLFNHTASDHCQTRVDSVANFIVANRQYQPGEEIFISYGSHTNDELWAEWGFMLDNNDNDSVDIDEIISRSLTVDERDIMGRRKIEEGRYQLNAEGVSDLVKQISWDVVRRERQKVGKDDKIGFKNSDKMELKAASTQVQWVLDAQRGCEESLDRLLRMNRQEIIQLFGDEIRTLMVQAPGRQKTDLEEFRIEQAITRHQMCVRRWRQIWEMAQSALRCLEQAHAGCFVTGGLCREKKDLQTTVDERIGNVSGVS